jgi:hypothetical protein
VKAIDWQSMQFDELTRELKLGRAMAARKAQELLEAAGLTQQKGRGRPSADPFASLLSGGVDPENQDEDLVSAAAE